ncbi:MAG TPA: UGSC family (seleno)protein, partial [Burkholderiales bacterium]|nr:UGSC family (seleno)protein [Burkholderiales bacterium]
MLDILERLPSDYDHAQQLLLDAGLTDGLPVVPPTRDRVQRMLAGCGREPDAVVAVLPPLFGDATWRDIAINAVMAGCTDDCLPVVGAAVAALADDAFNLLGIATTTGSATPLVIVGGPIVQRIAMNSGANVLGPGNRANATIGRAVHLAIQNIGGARPGEVDMSTLGQPA